MTIAQYESQLLSPLSKRTLVFFIKGQKVLLAMKKRGFGAGKWNGVGGKLNPGEDILSAAVRECQEEVGLTPLNLKKVGVLNFYFPLVSQDRNYDQQVVVFTSHGWTGSPAESEEMLPQWYDYKAIPFQQMWADDQYWLPLVLSGKLVKADFMFGEGEKVDEQHITQVRSFK